MLEAAPASGKRGTRRTKGMKNDGASKCHAHAASAGFWLAAACRWRSARRHCSSSRSEQCMRWSAQRRRRLQNDLSLQQSSTSSSPSESRRRWAFYSLARAFQPPASSTRRAGLLWMDTEADWRATQRPGRSVLNPQTLGQFQPATFSSRALAYSWSGAELADTSVLLKGRLDGGVYNLRWPVGLNWTAMKDRQNGGIMIHVAARTRRTCWSVAALNRINVLCGASDWARDPQVQ